MQVLDGVTGRCLDATCSANCSTVVPGAPVTVWSCRAGAANQAWTLTPAGQLVESMSGNCLEFLLCPGVGPGQCAGAVLQVFTCNGWAGQTWTRTAAGELRNGLTGFCADVLCPLGNCSGVADNTAADQWNCTGARNQRWTIPSLQPPPPGPRPPMPPPGPPPRVAFLPPMPGAAVTNATSLPPPSPPPLPPAAAAAAAAPETLSAKTVVPWAIGGGMIVALAGFTCGACTPLASKWLRNRNNSRNGAAVAPISEAGGPADSPSGTVVPAEGAAPPLFGCLPSWLLDRPPPPPQLPERPHHALARLSDRLARRVRLMRVIARAGSGAGGSFAEGTGAQGGDARRRSSGAPPPLPERPWRLAARRGAEERAQHEEEEEVPSEEFRLSP